MKRPKYSALNNQKSTKMLLGLSFRITVITPKIQNCPLLTAALCFLAPLADTVFEAEDLQYSQKACSPKLVSRFLHACLEFLYM